MDSAVGTSPSVDQVTALAVAEYFLGKAGERGKSLTNKKVQKLVYYAQVWSLVLDGEKLFDEDIQAWVHGPAIPSLYGEYKKFGFSPITGRVSDAVSVFSKKQTKLLDEVWDVYGKFDAGYLEMLSHSELPWQEAREGVSDVVHSDKVINLETARAFYAQKLKEIKENGSKSVRRRTRAGSASNR